MPIDVTQYQVAVAIAFAPGAEPSCELVEISKCDGKTELEPIVDADLNRFAKFYSEELANGNLSNFERAAIKTYLAWKMKVVQGK